MHNKRGNSLFESVGSVLIIILLAGFLAGYFTKVLNESKKTALIQNLNALRLTLNLYDMLNDKWPMDLRQLLSEEYTLSNTGKVLFRDKYLRSTLQDKEGFLVDPFGNRYSYDPETGEINSITRGYQNL